MSEGNYNYKFCPKCGARADSGDAFCVNCGAPLRQPAAQTQTTAQTAARPGNQTSAQTAAQTFTQTAAPKPAEKKCGAKGVVLVIIAAVILWAIFGNGSSNKVYKDYASAGAHVKAQILKHDEILYVSLNTRDYNKFLGGTPIANKILTQAFAYDKSADKGERLGLISWATQVEAYQMPQKDGSDNLNLKIHMRYFLTEDQEKELATAAQRILSSLNLSGKSDYEKVRAIYNYICSHMTYDYARLDDDSDVLKYTAYGAVKRSTAVCSGIADLFYYLANSAGVETHIKTNSVHAWNFVRLGGKYYYLDATWDLGKSEANYDYFLKGSADFQHYGGLQIGLFGNGNLLTDTDKGYTFSSFEYGSPYNDLNI
ncbi:MAG: zinc-ribbon domain-containing protein [Clostridia bacterium]|nr:zinc-ribbon domain-containing protein [Clostridia bacterium]